MHCKYAGKGWLSQREGGKVLDAKARQRRVRGLLEGFRGIEPLKRLFWSELGYERRGDPLSMRGWPGGASDALAEEPTILASGAEDGFEVVHCRLAGRLLVTSERLVIEKLLSEGHDRALFVFSDRDRERWHFVNARYSAGEDRRRVFRRIAVGPEEEHRTASERIAMLDLEAMAEKLRKDPEDLSPSTSRAATTRLSTSSPSPTSSSASTLASSPASRASWKAFPAKLPSVDGSSTA